MRPLTVPTRPTAPRSWSPRSAALLLAASVVAVALAGCSGDDPVTTVPGGGDGDGDTPVTSEPAPSTTRPPSKSPAPAGEATEADLTIVTDNGAGNVTTSTLTCSGAEVGGTLATASQACAQLAEAGSQALAAPPKDQMCTEVYGGPQTATITGTLGGRGVEATLARTNGCEIGRWDALSALVAAADPDS